MQNARHIGGLDLVRFWAALAVSVFHLGFWGWAYPGGMAARAAGPLPVQPELAWLGSFAWAGVEVFFVISGFVISYSAESASPGSFARSRFLRLVPGVWICATITSAMLLVVDAMYFREALIRFLRSAFFAPTGPWIDSVYWTLGIELAFYAGVWLLLLGKRLAWLEPVMIAVGLVSTVFWSAFLFGGWPDGYDSRAFDLILVHHGMLFAIGTLLARSAFDGVTARRVAFIALFALTACIQLSVRTEVQGMKTGYDWPAWPAIVFWLTSVAAIVASLRWPLSGRWLRPLGLMTYPLYLLHNVAGSAVLGMMVRAGTEIGWAIAAALLLSIGLSWCVAILLEPVLRAVLKPALQRLSPSRQA